MRIGILGGTFDPIHIGHLILAEEARQRLWLDKVLFVPTGQPYLRTSQPAASAHDRLAMVRIAVQDNPTFEASEMEVERSGPTYSVDTFQALHKKSPPGTEFFFILGQDAFLEIPTWKTPEALVSLCTLVVFRRPGGPAMQTDGEWSFGKTKAKVIVMDAPVIGVSGTELRRRVAQGLSTRYWLPAAVESYIKTHKLYQSG